MAKLKLTRFLRTSIIGIIFFCAKTAIFLTACNAESLSLLHSLGYVISTKARDSNNGQEMTPKLSWRFIYLLLKVTSLLKWFVLYMISLNSATSFAVMSMTHNPLKPLTLPSRVSTTTMRYLEPPALFTISIIHANTHWSTMLPWYVPLVLPMSSVCLWLKTNISKPSKSLGGSQVTIRLQNKCFLPINALTNCQHLTLISSPTMLDGTCLSNALAEHSKCYSNFFSTGLSNIM